MKKEEVLALVADKKVAAGMVFDDIAAAIDSIEIEVGGSDEALKLELEAVKAELEAMKLADVQEHADLDALKLSLDAAKSEIQGDNEKLAAFEAKIAKLKAILADLA